MILRKFYTLVLVLISHHFQLTLQDMNCKGLKTNAVWTCKLKSKCEWATQLTSSGKVTQCGSDDDILEQKICCPENLFIASRVGVSRRANVEEKSKNLTRLDMKDPATVVWEKCQEYAKARYVNITYQVLITDPPMTKKVMDCIRTETLIVNGKEVQEKEIPHMALIGYGESVDAATWDCGGSLISEQFILSAAHCTSPEGFQKKWATWVLLGRISKLEISEKLLNKNIFKIIQHFNHPQYKRFYENHDIALYKLSRPVVFNGFIRPTCLFTASEIPSNYLKKTLVAGWGRTGSGEDQSDQLLKTTINFVDNEVCLKRYKNEPKYAHGFDQSTMICSGDLVESNDTCGGDSGGPLQVPIAALPCMWHLIGITSLGDQFCGSNVPGVYTKVSYYVEWIQSIVWPIM